MGLLMVYLFILSIVLLIGVDVGENFLCNEKFCEEYLAEVGCPSMDLPCVIQNATHNGQVFPSPTECNCCKICVANLSMKFCFS